jgi:hypothetical protein
MVAHFSHRPTGMTNEPSQKEQLVRRWQTLAAVAIATSALVGSTVSGTKTPEQNIVLTGGRDSSRDGYHFDIKASSVRGLYPGATKHIDLTIVNSYSFPLRITSVRGRLVDTSKSGCRAVASNLKVAAYGGQLPLTIPAKSRKSAGRIDVRMPNTVVDACQRATFSIRVAGSATKAAR